MRPGIVYPRAVGSPSVVADNIFVNEVDEQGGDTGLSVTWGRNVYFRPVARATSNSIFAWRD